MLRGKLFFMSTDNRHTEKKHPSHYKKLSKQAWFTQIIANFVSIMADMGLSVMQIVDIHNMIT